MKVIKQNGGAILLCLCELLLGVLLLLDAQKYTALIIRIVGVALLLMGIVSVIRYFRLDALQSLAEHDLSTGLILVAAGLFGIFRAKWIMDTFQVITFFYGIAIGIVGITKLENAVSFLRMRLGAWKLAALNAVLTLVLAVLIIANPFNTVKVLITFTAITLIVVAVLDALALIFAGRGAKQEEA